MDPGDGAQNSKNVQKPQNYDDNHDCIQDRLNGARHGDEVVDEPQENTDDNQSHHYLNQRHNLNSPPSFISYISCVWVSQILMCSAWGRTTSGRYPSDLRALRPAAYRGFDVVAELPE